MWLTPGLITKKKKKLRHESKWKKLLFWSFQLWTECIVKKQMKMFFSIFRFLKKSIVLFKVFMWGFYLYSLHVSIVKKQQQSSNYFYFFAVCLWKQVSAKKSLICHQNQSNICVETSEHWSGNRVFKTKTLQENFIFWLMQTPFRKKVKNRDVNWASVWPLSQLTLALLFLLVARQSACGSILRVTRSTGRETSLCSRWMGRRTRWEGDTACSLTQVHKTH